MPDCAFDCKRGTVLTNPLDLPLPKTILKTLLFVATNL